MRTRTRNETTANKQALTEGQYPPEHVTIARTWAVKAALVV